MAMNFPASPAIGQIYTSGGATFIWDGTKWKTVATAAIPDNTHGGVRMDRSDATTLKIAPYNGNRLIIDGESRVVPTAYLTKGATGSLWFVYAYMNAGVVAFENSATGPTMNTSGVMVKSGDATRSLIGCYYVLGDTGTLEDSASRRCILNWYNRIPRSLSLAVNGSTAATAPPVQVGGTGYFVMWPFQAVQVHLSAYITTNATDHVFTSARIDTASGAEMGERCNLGDYKTAGGSLSTEFMSNTTVHSFGAGLRTTGAATATVIGSVYGTIDV